MRRLTESAAAILAGNSLRENLRGRFFMLTVVFGLTTLYLSLLLGLLAADQELRVIQDFGLGLIELLGLAGAVYSACTVILREMETKTIYLILTRPVGRGEYLLGRFLGLMLSAAASMALMAAVHLAILLAKGWHPEAAYFWAFLGALLKVLVTASLATFLALWSSSVPTAMGIVFIVWSLGHFLPEIRYMISWGAPGAAAGPMLALSYVVPDLQLFNLRDRLTATALSAPERGLGVWLAYAAAYSASWLAAARWVLGRKEF